MILARAGKYDPLLEHLQTQRSMVLRMSFERITALVGALPPTALKSPAWWSNEPTDGPGHVQCKAWLENGYKARPNLKAQTVTFERDDW